MVKNSLPTLGIVKINYRDILVCEDQTFCQRGIEFFLRELIPDLEKIRTVSTGSEALKEARRKQPDLVMMDLGLPDISGIEVIKQLNLNYPQMKILVVTAADSPPQLMQVCALNVSGIMQKATSFGEFSDILWKIQKNEKKSTPVLDKEIQRILDEQGEVDLTSREYEVLEKMVLGHSNAEIADSLGCALSTVRFHRSNIMQKTNIRTVAEITAWFLKGQRKP